MIRVATAADVAVIAELGGRFIRETSYRSTYAPNVGQFAAIAAAFVADADKLALVSERAGAVTGMLLGSVFAHPLTGQPIAAELVWWVNPDARGGGWQLLRAFERWAQSQGAEVVQMVAPAGERVGRLYERLGYRVTEIHFERALP